MKNYAGHLVCAMAAAICLSAPAFSQASDQATDQATPGTFVRDWTDDGTRDRLLLGAAKLFGYTSEFYLAMPREEANRELIVSQFTYAFHGFPEPEFALPGGRKLFVGDAPESHKEKALIVTDADRATMRAVALLHGSCGGKPRFDEHTKKMTTCPSAFGLTFFVRSGDSLDDDVKAEVVQWAKDFAKRNNAEIRKFALKAPGQRIDAINIDVYTLPGL